MNTERSHALLNLLITRNNARDDRTNFAIKLWLRFMVFLSIVFQFINHHNKNIPLTVLSGRAVRYGAGSFSLSQPTLTQLLMKLWHSKCGICTVPPHDEKSFIECLSCELTIDNIETMHFSLTPHGILMIQYRTHNVAVLLKVTATEQGNAYLNRQEIGLTNNHYIDTLGKLNICTPNIMMSELKETEQALMQSFVDGIVLTGTNKTTSMFNQQIGRCIETTLSVNKELGCCTDQWSAYDDFSQLPQYYHSWQQPLGIIVTHINTWLSQQVMRPVHIHGDYHLGNIIFDCNQANIVGMIDFDRSCAGGVPLHDSLMLVLTDAGSESKFLGENVRSVFDDDYGQPLLSRNLATVVSLSGYSQCEVKYMVIVVWLFVLQSAMREGLKVSDQWQKKMIAETVSSVHGFCSQQNRANEEALCLTRS